MIERTFLVVSGLGLFIWMLCLFNVLRKSIPKPSSVNYLGHCSYILYTVLIALAALALIFVSIFRPDLLPV